MDNIEIDILGQGGPTDPNVAYMWGYGLTGDAAKYARLEKITLPGGREIYYNYESQYESLAKFASLNRVANIAANSSPNDANTYVAYKHEGPPSGDLGASMVVEADHPAVPNGLPEGPPSGRLTYAGATSGGYSGLDPASRLSRYARASRFGRVVWQRWPWGTGRTFPTSPGSGRRAEPSHRRCRRKKLPASVPAGERR